MHETSMHTPRSPLAASLVSGHYGAAGVAGITLGTRGLKGLWQIAGWQDFTAAAASVLDQLGMIGPGDYRHALKTGGAIAWRTAPDRMLIETATDLTVYASPTLAVLDLGHARAVITLAGPAARDVLAQVVPIDLSSAVFGPCAFVQTGIHNVGVLIHCREPERFDILLPGTWAETLWEVLCQNAAPHGYEITSQPEQPGNGGETETTNRRDT